MKVYFIRHGKALPNTTDAIRPLSEPGKAETEKIASILAFSGLIKATCIFHSELLRSKQTAQILANHLNPKNGLKLMAGLDPFDSPEWCINMLNSLDEDVIVAGHEPHLSTTASQMLTGVKDRMDFIFNKSGIICLQKISDKKWCVAPLFVFDKD
jgi:phosphohistidine phosphatase